MKFNLENNNYENLFIHFDVDGHYIELDTFIKTGEQAKAIIDTFNESFFQNELQYRLILLPPEPGSFLTKIAVYVFAVGVPVFYFLESDIGKAYIKGLTNREPYEFALELGKYSRDKMIQALADFEESRSLKSIDLNQVDKCQLGSRVVVEMTRGLLEKNKDEIQKLSLNDNNLGNALDARSEFFTACIEDAKINGIGFSDENHFPIPRNQFPNRAVNLRKDEENDTSEDEAWTIAIEEIIVTSPNWDKDDQLKRQWKGKNNINQEVYFIIEDKEFWLQVYRKKLNVEILDKLKVQWAYLKDSGRIKNRRVLRVLELNGNSLGAALDANSINAIVGEFSEKDDAQNDTGLFK
jgi:hypothetical protein